MGQKKLQRFSEIKTFQNVLEYPAEMKGKWNTWFNNKNPIVLELACGKGEYAVGLGRLKPGCNFIGVDVKGNRMWAGAKQALAENLSNVAFLRTQIEKIADYFAPGEIAGIWITFPDPQLRTSKAKKRLTHPRFLRLYQSFLQIDGCVHLKTDSPDLFQFTRQVIALFNLNLSAEVDDVYAQPNVPADLQITTHYERLDIARSNRIHYLRFSINKQLPPDKDELLKPAAGEE